jgi:hypothetical protein
MKLNVLSFMCHQKSDQERCKCTYVSREMEGKNYRSTCIYIYILYVCKIVNVPFQRDGGDS